MTGCGTEGLGQGHHIERAGWTVSERDRDATVVIVQGDDLIAEDVLGAVAGAIDDDARQLIPQNLQLGGGPAGLGRRGREARDGITIAVDELGAYLACRGGPDRLLDVGQGGAGDAGSGDENAACDDEQGLGRVG